jgi:hypothetical protein
MMGAGSCVRRVFAGGAVLVALAGCGVAAAQTPESTDRPGVGRLTLGGDATATAGPADTDAFFNFTNYDQNALRAAQVRLVGEWRLSSTVSFLGELRAESGAGVDGAAWYLRWHPSAARAFDVQVGRIPPVVGLFAREPYGRDNLLIGAPLAYQYLLSLRPDALPASTDDLIRMRGRGWEPSFPIGSSALAPGIPIVSAFRWDTGAEAHWHAGRADVAGAVTRGSASVPAVGRDVNGGETWSGRVAVSGPGGLTVGVSGARGPWIQSSTLSLLPASLRAPDTQTLLGLDVEFGWGRWLVHGEELRSVFDMPIVDATNPEVRLAAWSGYLEARYRLHPRWQVAGRVEQLDFSTIQGTLNGGRATTWDAPVERLSADIGYRVERQLEIRAGWQMNWRDGGRVTKRGYPALQLLFWF